MNEAFRNRLEPGNEFEAELLAKLSGRKSILSVAKNGTEHTHPEFVALLRQLNSPAAKFIRFAPDGVMLTAKSKVIHYDAKFAKSIEKEAYAVYMQYVSAGCQLILFVTRPADKVVFWQYIDKLKLIPAELTVRRYPIPAPIDADGWIAPDNAP